ERPLVRRLRALLEPRFRERDELRAVELDHDGVDAARQAEVLPGCGVRAGAEEAGGGVAAGVQPRGDGDGARIEAERPAGAGAPQIEQIDRALEAQVERARDAGTGERAAAEHEPAPDPRCPGAPRDVHRDEGDREYAPALERRAQIEEPDPRRDRDLPDRDG